ncbi:hypothetical protein BGZ95_002888 [Linnemannia exigua]|uniref:G domain-containing protein n=1 Tax=Linnemannia exigua TaxID=604196 RepID=A0AAD4D4X1_9FUNG|nr:hypothetical protein BGZ95_002888 [Linnemannia exigua]
MASRAYALRLTGTTRPTGTTGRSYCHCILTADAINILPTGAAGTPLRRRVYTSRLYTSSSSASSSAQRYPCTPLLSSPPSAATRHYQHQQRLHGTFLARIQPSAYFNTHSIIRQLTTSTPSVDQAATTDDSTAQAAAALNALVGLPCPGCGSTFQTTSPQEPGYLTTPTTRSFEDKATDAVGGKKEKQQGKNGKGPKAPAVAANATTMSHAQYENYLEMLDPKLLKEIMSGGEVAPEDASGVTAGQESGSELESGAGAGAGSMEAGTPGSTEEVTESFILDKKPTLTPKPTSTTTTPSRLVCHRCHSLSHHASPLSNTSSSSGMFPSPPAPIPKHLETLAQSKTSTVVLVVDLIDFPLSLPQPVIQELLKVKKAKKANTGTGFSKEGDKKEYPTTPIILVGNKFDVMPKGTSKHTILHNLQKYLTAQGLDSNIRAIHCVSAKNPEGDEIRMLLKSIGTAWSKSGKGNVVMVGGENVGKSQLLNAFLKEGARWRPNEEEKERKKGEAGRIERQKKLGRLLGGSATTTSLDDDSTKDNGGDEEEEDKEWAAMTGKSTLGSDMDQYSNLYKSRGQEKLEKYQTTVSNVPGTTLERIKVPLSVLSRFMGATYKEVQTKWLMDTPGIRPEKGQVTSWLTLEELKVTVPKKVLKPVSFTLEEGKSFFLGGLVRIDCLSIGKSPSLSSIQDPTAEDNQPVRRSRGSNPVPKLTIFSTLPLHKTSTTQADKFLDRAALGDLTILQPPFGSPERLAAFPGLKPVSEKDVVIVNRAPAPSSFAPYASSSSSSSSNGERSYEESSDPFARLGSTSSCSSSSFSTTTQLSPYDTLTRRERETSLLQYNGQYGICDLVFSGIGWIMISGKFHGDDQAVRLRLWTPQGQGAMVREPALLPELAGEGVEKTSGGIRRGKGKKSFQTSRQK